MRYNLAQINIARMLAPLDSPVMKDFADNVERINQLAEISNGFVWRFIEDDVSDSAVQVFHDDYIVVNMSVWKSMEALLEFTYRSEHRKIFKRRKEWFSKMKRMHMACWFMPEGKYPNPLEGKERLEYLDKFGETPYAFTLKSNFTVKEAGLYKPETRKKQ